MRSVIVAIVFGLTLSLRGSITPTHSECVFIPETGCLAVLPSITATLQTFQDGLMIYRADTHEIYVLTWHGEFQVYSDTWKGEALPQATPSDEDQLQQPQRRFGRLWLDDPEVRERLRWAVSGEVQYLTPIETIKSLTYLYIPERYSIRLDHASASWYYVYIQAPEPMAVIQRDFTNGKVGPSDDYFTNTYLYDGRRYPVVGRDITGEWWQIEANDTHTWVPDQDVTVVNVEVIPIIESAPCVNAMSPTCPVEQRTTQITLQTFQHGIMLRREDSAPIFLLLYADEHFGYYADEWDGLPLAQENPPAGLYQPQAAFGYLWLNNPLLRQRLGWATEAAVVYTATLEISDGTSYAPSDDVTYIPLSDGRAIGMSWYAGRWFFLDQP